MACLTQFDNPDCKWVTPLWIALTTVLFLDVLFNHEEIGVDE